MFLHYISWATAADVMNDLIGKIWGNHDKSVELPSSSRKNPIIYISLSLSCVKSLGNVFAFATMQLLRSGAAALAEAQMQCPGRWKRKECSGMLQRHGLQLRHVETANPDMFACSFNPTGQ